MPAPLSAMADAAELTRFAAPPDGRPTPEMLTAFRQDGFLAIRNFADVANCDALMARAGEIVAAFDPSGGAGVFSTLSHRHAEEEYFATSGDKIRCFLEEEACDTAGNLIADKSAAINKIGHALHDLDPLFDRFSRDHRLAALANGLGLGRPLLLQSMYIFKQPRIGGEVVCHQDGAFLYTEPESVIGFWFALEDATIENGCLHALRGQHRGPLRRRFRQRGGALRLETLNDAPWDEETVVPIEAVKGDLVVLHGRLPHLSGANRSNRSRHAYTLHVIDGSAAYPADNWLQRGAEMPLRGFR